MDQPIQRPVRLPDGTAVEEPGPVVIIGPNGAGKSRKARLLTSDVPTEVVSAMRNTRISPHLQPVALNQAKQNFISQRDVAREQPYELTNDFDFMLTALIGEGLEPSLKFLRESREGKAPELPPLSSLEKVAALWKQLFPGRWLEFREYVPLVHNSVALGDEPVEYSAWQMSDGEKAALYLAGRVFSADANAVLIVDEPETHFHSLLAVQFWDAVEQVRPDLRLVYVTHDMTFAASRHAVRYLLANPTHGLTQVELAANTGDLAATLLGTASLSFYATQVIFCEGDAEALDFRLYSAWFDSAETIVQAVGSRDMVLRSVSALSGTKLVQNLTVQGIVDRDFSSDELLGRMPAGVKPLSVHEVETLWSLPGLVESVAKHLKVAFDRPAYEQRIKDAYKDEDRHRVVLERWRERVEDGLGTVVSSVSTKSDSLESISKAIPSIFDQSTWSFAPQDILTEEKARIEGLFAPDAALDPILSIMPGKHLRSLPASALGVKPAVYEDLILKALSGDPDLTKLGQQVRAALAHYMPSVTSS